MYYQTTCPSPLGEITLACRGDQLAGLWIEGQKYHGDTLSEKWVERNDVPVFHAAKKWLERYFSGERPAVSELPLAPAGSAFRQEVWGMLCEIPYGEVLTYGDIAKKMAEKLHRPSMSSQAVGGAVGHNPLSIIIPCHRVVGSNGSLTGYAGGIGTKIKLLQLEGVDTSRFFVPTKSTAL
ncbi:methylated-DNA--[protein]-cysteine S-methyltransferase [Ruminococcaceae bacterium OttesenSCG-928-I18]|nr:methylated-DNA--[protein]-cysteine S-methyltransferase [Ruminococcaceae bacterium OttesenSCG-928-I18]